MDAIANIARAFNGYTDRSIELEEIRNAQQQRKEQQRQNQLKQLAMQTVFGDVFGNMGSPIVPLPVQATPVTPILGATQQPNPNTQMGAQAGNELLDMFFKPSAGVKEVVNPLLPTGNAQQQQPELIDPYQVEQELDKFTYGKKQEIMQLLTSGNIDLKQADKMNAIVDYWKGEERNRQTGGNIDGIISALNHTLFQDGGDTERARGMAHAFATFNPALKRFIGDPNADTFAERIAYLSSLNGKNADVLKRRSNISEQGRIDDHETANNLVEEEYEQGNRQALAQQKYENSVALEDLKQAGKSNLSPEQVLRIQKLQEEITKLQNTNQDTSNTRIKNSQNEINKTKDAYSTISGVISLIDSTINLGQKTLSDASSIIDVAQSNIYSTAEYDLRENIKTIKSNIGFDKLQQMRDASPTGGALGQVTERELEYLQSTLGSLEIGQSKEQLLKNLQIIKDEYSRIFDKVDQDRERLGIKIEDISRNKVKMVVEGVEVLEE